MGARVMHRFLSLVTRFGRDERGVFAVLFGLMAIVLVALGGSVVDYMRLEQTRSRAQTALDAAALALQPLIFTKPLNQADILAKAQALVADRIAQDNLGVSTSAVDVIRVNVANGSLYLEGTLSVPTIFVSLVGVPQLSARFNTEATRRMLNLEVAMVLDNSGSMANYNRITYLKRAANCATNILFFDGQVNKSTNNCTPLTGATAVTNVKIGIIPFTTMVNIGTGYSNETWLDWTGASSIGKLNFDTDDDDSNVFAGAVDRRTLFTNTSTTWRGCVEARLAPNDTTDVAPTTNNTKFVPFFVPDPASGLSADYITDTGGTCKVKTCEHVQKKTNCSYNSWTGVYTCTGTTTNSYTKKVDTTTTTPSASCIAADGMQLSSSQSYSGTTLTTTTLYSLLSKRELQERMCKYSGTSPGNNATNGSCPTLSLLPLNNNPVTVRAKITAMAASGGTNIQQGAIWGFHALTPSEPLTEGLVNVAASVKKVMIVMTDGFNEPSFEAYSSDWNGSDYSSWGYRKDGRLADTDGIIGNQNEYNAFNSQADMTAVMNAKTEATCANAKAAGIEVYTIGLSPPSQASIDSLTRCSSGAGYYFFPTDPTELVGVFITIAGQLAQLRLAQ